MTPFTITIVKHVETREQSYSEEVVQLEVKAQNYNAASTFADSLLIGYPNEYRTVYSTRVTDSDEI